MSINLFGINRKTSSEMALLGENSHEENETVFAEIVMIIVLENKWKEYI